MGDSPVVAVWPSLRHGSAAWRRLGLLCAAAALAGGCAQNASAPAAAGGSVVETVVAGPPAPPDPVAIERRARLRLELAGLYFGRGQTQTAMDELKAALQAKPDLPEAYSLQGLIYASQGDAASAEQSFQKALSLNPRDADAMHNYGWFLCQQRRYAEGDAQFASAVAQPQYQDAVRTLLARGVCQARAGQWADAERTLSRSYELDPSNPTTAYNLSEVLMRRGELERARFYVRRVNQVPELVSAQSLWLAARIERRLGNLEALQDFGRQLRDRFPRSTETLQFERGRFDD